jgi:hypothetical protein
MSPSVTIDDLEHHLLAGCCFKSSNGQFPLSGDAALSGASA